MEKAKNKQTTKNKHKQKTTQPHHTKNQTWGNKQLSLPSKIVVTILSLS